MEPNILTFSGGRNAPKFTLCPCCKLPIKLLSSDTMAFYPEHPLSDKQSCPKSGQHFPTRIAA